MSVDHVEPKHQQRRSKILLQHNNEKNIYRILIRSLQSLLAAFERPPSVQETVPATFVPGFITNKIWTNLHICFNRFHKELFLSCINSFKLLKKRISVRPLNLNLSTSLKKKREKKRGKVSIYPCKQTFDGASII